MLPPRPVPRRPLLALGVALALGAGGWTWLRPALGRQEVLVGLLLPPAATGRSVDLELRRGGQVVRTANVAVPAGARQVSHRLTLHAGRYHARALCSRDGRTLQASAEFDVPGGAPVINLAQEGGTP
ncbi:MAG: hypothetical protein HY904_02875 [Deltaproteobacteria bacterium]|nr:hypothetical protein [Deltaproteobacteria bacterium]